MKVTHQEQEYLKSLLWSNVKYQETYNEVYDHVLTAVEVMPETEDLKPEIFDAIINSDFGEIGALQQLEAERVKIVSNTIRKKQRQYQLSYFKLPLLLFTVLLAGTMYYAADAIPRKAVLLIVLIVGFSPAVIIALRGIVRFFKRKNRKPSIKDKVIEQIGCLSISLFNLFMFLPPLFVNDDNYKFFKQAHASLIAVTALFFLPTALALLGYTATNSKCNWLHETDFTTNPAFKKYLRDTLSYRETYEEVYDHILTAVENNSGAQTFEEAINAIIQSDFGGVKGLLKMEKDHYKAVVNDVIKQQWLQFIDYLKFPAVLFSLLLFAVIYSITSTFSTQLTAIVILLFALSIVPGVLVLYRYFRIGYAIKDTKRSIKDRILGQVASRPLLFCNPGIFILIGKSKASLWIGSHPFITSLIIAVVVLYVFAFIKLCQRDIKAYSLI